ncbi:hypothetical protein M8J76_013135 [Diaphorina citri]|nr:hypothetical protein M8J76_013135 [Diaphorina citri]
MVCQQIIRPLHRETPLQMSQEMTDLLGCPVLMKMENLQLAGSYKMRGIGNRCQMALLRGCERFVGASGGNAGVALARAARILNVPATVYVPVTASPMVVKKLQQDGAIVKIVGNNFNEAAQAALREVDEPRVSFIHAYDHPDIWEGHTSLVQELVYSSPKPSCIITAVGGGGLLTGILMGLKEYGWTDVPIVAMETEGAHCFNLSMHANKKIVLNQISSIAVTLGAASVCDELMRLKDDFKIYSRVITDKQAVESCIQFADSERQVVEPACGAALSAIYCGVVRDLADQGYVDLTAGPAVLVVCGGSGVSLEQLQIWDRSFGINYYAPAGETLGTMK